MGGSKRKIVLFYYKEQNVGGSLIFLLQIARELAKTSAYDEVYYVNIPNKKLESMYWDEKVTYCDARTCDYSIFEGADFFVSLNYLHVLLDKVKDIEKGKILLFDWHPQIQNFLFNQYLTHHRDDKELLQMLEETKSLAFMDESCRLSINQWSDVCFPKNYIPVCQSLELKVNSETFAVKDRISIGWMGRLDNDKIYALINLLDNLKKWNTDQKIDLHIIGDGESRNKINISKYAPKIRLIFTSYLYGEERDAYITENIDLMVSMGMSALDVANLRVPVVIAPIEPKTFHHNAYVFLHDVDGYSLGWDYATLSKMGYVKYTIVEAIKEVYVHGRKTELGQKSYEFAHNNFSVEKSVEMFLEAMNASELTIEKCFNNENVKRQMDDYSLYKKLRPHRDYFSYISFVGKMRKIEKQGLPGLFKYTFDFLVGKRIVKGKQNIKNKVKGKIKNFKKRQEHIKKYKKVQASYPKKIEEIRKIAKANGSIKVAFLVIFSSVFQTEPIFRKMLDDSFFDPYIIVIPDMQRSKEQKISAYTQTYDELSEKYGDRVIGGFDVATNEYYEPHDDYQLVCFNNPYSKMAHKFHHVTYFLDKNVLTLYPYYGFAAVKYGRNLMTTDFYNYVWKLCVDSKMNYIDLKKHQPMKGKNGFVTGYLKMDRLSECKIVERSRKKIIICPHHTVLGWKSLDISNFMRYSDFFLKLPKLFPEIDFVFRPHPLLFSNLRENNIWTNEQIENYISAFNSMPNAEYDNSGDYFDLFINSDAMIHDCSSFIGEYLFTEKPCCYMLKDKKEINKVLLPMGKACMKQYYKSFDEEDILRFINDVVIKGKDPLKKQREYFVKNVLKFNYPNGTETILEYIKETLQK